MGGGGVGVMVGVGGLEVADAVGVMMIPTIAVIVAVGLAEPMNPKLITAVTIMPSNPIMATITVVRLRPGPRKMVLLGRRSAAG